MVCARQVPCSTSAALVSQPCRPSVRPAPGAGAGPCPGALLSSPEYVITMYDTKSRELRWNATFSDYSAPLCEESYHYSEQRCAHGSCGTPGRCCQGQRVSAVPVAGANGCCAGHSSSGSGAAGSGPQPAAG